MEFLSDYSNFQEVLQLWKAHGRGDVIRVFFDSSRILMMSPIGIALGIFAVFFANWYKQVFARFAAIPAVVELKSSIFIYHQAAAYFDFLIGRIFLRLLPWGYITLIVLLPFVAVIWHFFLGTPRYSFLDSFSFWFRSTWPLYVGLVVTEYFSLFITYRTTRWVGVVLERWLQAKVVKAETRIDDEVYTDARTVADTLPKTIDFDPRKFYSDGRVFLGLKSDKKPVYVSRDTWRVSHMDVMGTTGIGKGVSASGLCAQLVEQYKDAVFIIDPKNDEWAPHVMRIACERAGLPFHLVNLNPEFGPQFNLLNGCSQFQIEELLEAGFGLSEKGRDSDHYRLADRRALRGVAPLGVGLTLRELFETSIAGNSQLFKVAPGFAANLEEVSELNCLATRDAGGFKSVLDHGGCVYVIGSMSISRVVKLQKMLIMRLMQMVGSRPRDSVQRQATIFLDEFKYLLSFAAIQGLGTIRDKRGNLILAHQSLNDLRECGDLDEGAVRGAVLENTAIKFIHRLEDANTAHWVAQRSGTIRVNEYQKQSIMDDVQTETIVNTGGVMTADRYRFDVNQLLSLPNRVAAVFTPEGNHLVSAAPYLAEKSELHISTARSIGHRGNTYVGVPIDAPAETREQEDLL